MKRAFLHTILIAVVGLAASCEKVIDIPLNEADQQVVVEAVGRSFLGESYVLLSKTGTVYDDTGFEKRSGATVTVTDKDGVETTFTEDPLQLGRYVAPTFQTTANNSYDLRVVLSDGEVLTASSTTNSIPVLDSLSFIQQNGGFGGFTDDTTFLVFYSFTDNGAEENFYRIRAWVNGEADNNYYIGNDVLGNGKPTTAPLFATESESKDTVYVELLSIDEDTYTYMLTLSNNISQGAFSATPANPVSNIEGGGIGYFGAYTIDTATIIMP